MTPAHPRAQAQVLEALSGAHNYRRWVCQLCLPYLGDDPLELGSGLGDYAREWLDAGVPRMTVSDIDPSRAAGLRDRFATDDRVEVVDDPPRSDYSSVVAVNVLEHIADDAAALRVARGLIRPGGAIIVPAVPAAMSRFDRDIGHHRRYTRKSLRRMLALPG